MLTINSDRSQLDSKRSLAAKFFSENYSREERYLIILSRDLLKGFDAINSLGIEKAKSFQLYFDFICDFERLKELMKEYSWTKEKLAENGIDFVSLRKLYFAVA
jgi:hypothetical protein